MKMQDVPDETLLTILELMVESQGRVRKSTERHIVALRDGLRDGRQLDAGLHAPFWSPEHIYKLHTEQITQSAFIADVYTEAVARYNLLPTKAVS
jgi:hypothetical protein